MDEAELRLAASSWLEVLEPIPTRWLDECYRIAMRDHDLNKPFAAALLLRAYRDLVSQGLRESANDSQRYLPTEEQCEFRCSKDGWVTVDDQGNSPASDYMGVTYSKRCPIHRPARWHTGASATAITEEKYKDDCRKQDDYKRRGF